MPLISTAPSLLQSCLNRTEKILISIKGQHFKFHLHSNCRHTQTKNCSAKRNSTSVEFSIKVEKVNRNENDRTHHFDLWAKMDHSSLCTVPVLTQMWVYSGLRPSFKSSQLMGFAVQVPSGTLNILVHVLWFSSVPLGKCWNSTSNKVTAASSTSFIVHHLLVTLTIRHYTMSTTDRVINR
jgi:hypothetical protein